MDSNTDESPDYDFRIVAQQTESALDEFGPRVDADYRKFKQDFLKWLSTLGKNPTRRRGYSATTLKTTNYKVDKAYRWLWRTEGKYSLNFGPTHADEMMEELALMSNYADSTLLTFVKAIKRLFKYKNHQENTDHEWDCKVQLSQATTSNTRDYFRQSEFPALYEAALSYNTVKSYNNSTMTPEERENLKIHLAQRFGVEKEHISPDHFKRANCWKVPSLVSVTLDTGLRPIEVGRATVDWVNLQHGELNIPKEESTKNYENWSCALSQKTVDALGRWMNERQVYEDYDGRDDLWLTQRANPYDSNSLNYLLDKLLEEADIDSQGRDLSWYSIRHGVATLWANNEGIHHARDQLRHKSSSTTMRYVHSDSKIRGEKADSMW
ncbi:tyrosine-type recombinase/integrase [Salinigranum halophilum]|uniref:tyrosine-type recombinase/integrase n=1 Tax=Salinigranum halophilum TaxID=2565931 RepID=UPI00115D59EC|nr:site-specific integrase [Salinigranum halophilum]